jgi:hypothetical protein
LFFSALAAFGILTGSALLVFGEAMSEIRAQLLLAGVVIAGAVSSGVWLRGLSKLKIARLIAENPILHISTAVISDISTEAVQPESTENIEVVVSYFGILLDGKIIKFNQDGIRLRAMESVRISFPSPTVWKSGHRAFGFCARQSIRRR